MTEICFVHFSIETTNHKILALGCVLPNLSTIIRKV